MGGSGCTRVMHNLSTYVLLQHANHPPIVFRFGRCCSGSQVCHVACWCDVLRVTCSVTFFAGVIDACYMESVVSCEVIAANVDSTYRLFAANA